MKKLPEVTSHPDLVSEIIGQFAFMILMASPEDTNYDALQDFNLQNLFKKADEFFLPLTVEESIIMCYECDLHSRIAEFLTQYDSIIDVDAVQQSIHFRLYTLG